MKKISLALALATMGSVAGAAPLGIDLSKAYVAGMASYHQLDRARPADTSGYGGHIAFGLPVTEGLNLELATFGTYMPRNVDDKADLHYGLGLDALFLSPRADYTLFFLAGAGALREDITKVESVAPYLNVGVGLTGPINNLFGWVPPQLSYRAEVRGVVDINDDAAPGTDTFYVFEPRLNLGVQYGFGFAAPAPEAPVAPMDSDADGVADASDLCPNTPPGTVVDATGCPAAPTDTDGDGVVDALDQCPGTPAGIAVGPNGCPPTDPVAPGNPDEDGDGVLNEMDKCPGTPPSFKVDTVGCLVEQTVALQNVNFELGSDKLTAGAVTILDGIATSLLAQTAVKVQITGHTDALGPQSFNLALSQRRAKSVMLYLAEKGVAPNRLSSDGEGEFSPVASNDTEEGRAQNRRVEFKILAQ